MNIQIRMKRGLIFANHGHEIKDGRKCGSLEAAPGTFNSCQCKKVYCANQMSKIETVVIQRIRYNRKGIFSNGYLAGDPNKNWEMKYAKPIRTFLMLSEVRFY